MEQIALLLAGFVEKYPVIASVISVVGILRLVVKPLMTILQSVAGATESQKDDQFLQDVEQSKIWKGVLFIIDWVASVKPLKK